MPKYWFIGEHAEDLGEGQMLEPGQEVELSEKEAKPLLEAGKLYQPSAKKEEK
jgi:hypothetical protein